MPLFSPRRYQKAWLPLGREPLPIRVVAAVERAVKGALFGCRMCGNCILQETFLACPMTCPKGLRNGPCGESGEEHCVVNETRPCTWYIIYQRAERAGQLDKLLEINAPVDGDRAGHESWLSLLRFWLQRKQGPNLLESLTNRKKFIKEYDRLLYDLRQPDWWRGDAIYHPPLYEKPVSALEVNLRSQPFITTAEIEAPLDISPEEISVKAKTLKDFVISANFADNAFCTSRMSSVAGCKICEDSSGLETVMQIQTRDRSRALIESDVLGAAGLGIRNILCLGGNYFDKGPTPISKPDQFDLDAVQLLWMLRRMRDEGKLIDGRVLEQRPQYFLGAASNPFAAPAKYTAIRVEKKVNAGAQFIQTQMIFDYGHFTEWLEALDRQNLLNKVFILASVMPIRTAADIKPMIGANGHSIPEAVIKRMDAAFEKDRLADNSHHQVAEGFAITIETIEKLKLTPGVSGIHLMSGGQEGLVPRIIEAAGLPKPGIRSFGKSMSQ
jgi:methylenetetrahydrofolate reductase (NADPH)